MAQVPTERAEATEDRVSKSLSVLVRLLAAQAAHEAVAASSVDARADEDPENEQEQDHQ